METVDSDDGVDMPSDDESRDAGVPVGLKGVVLKVDAAGVLRSVDVRNMGACDGLATNPE